MWNRIELKQNAKVILKANYWKAVVAGLIIMASGGAFASTNVKVSGDDVKKMTDKLQDGVDTISTEKLIGILAVIGLIGLIGFVVSSVGAIFLSRPLQVGAQRMFVKCRDNAVQFEDVLYIFKENYLNVVKTEFFKSLYLFLWSCLFFVPGIIKAYEYRMVTYILAENPNMEMNEVFRKSKDMMMGNKWNAFVMDVSFIGWHFLGAITGMILEIFYVMPYQSLANAELYHTLKNWVK